MGGATQYLGRLALELVGERRAVDLSSLSTVRVRAMVVRVSNVVLLLIAGACQQTEYSAGRGREADPLSGTPGRQESWRDFPPSQQPLPAEASLRRGGPPQNSLSAAPGNRPHPLTHSLTPPTPTQHT